MQTFLPYSNFKESVKVLDDKRLGKQRVEAYQIISAITGRPRKDGKPYRGWINHPCTIMWRDYVNALRLYYNECIDEWIDRGHNNTMLYEPLRGKIVFPPWLGDENFHSSHRANLLRKDLLHYGQFGWVENPEDPYVWLDADGKWYRQMVGKNIRDYFYPQKELQLK